MEIKISRPVRLICAVIAALFGLVAQPAAAHPVPYSYLDLVLGERAIEGTLRVHATDLAHDLQIAEPQSLLDQRVLDEQYSAIGTLLAPRLRLAVPGGQQLALRFTGIAPLAEDAAVELTFVTDTAPPALEISTNLFPHDEAHQTFVNLYEGGVLAQQFLFDHHSPARVHYAGTAAGVLAGLGTFIPAGVGHVLIGPDHVLFLIGLVLLGGTLRRLALIVTAFTLGHSVTLALAALDIVSPPAWVIEPLIALSIVVVAADNLLRKPGDRDLRAGFALIFGFVHGFGFAYVLREFGLPQASLAWSLFGFNLGVELGQLAIVVPVALALAALRHRWPGVANRIVVAASLAVLAAGAYWFVDRVLNMGSGQG